MTIRAYTNDVIRVRLRPSADTQEPELLGVVLSTNGNLGGVTKVRIVSEHPAWHGVEIGRRQFRAIGK